MASATKVVRIKLLTDYHVSNGLVLVVRVINIQSRTGNITIVEIQKEPVHEMVVVKRTVYGVLQTQMEKNGRVVYQKLVKKN